MQKAGKKGLILLLALCFLIGFVPVQTQAAGKKSAVRTIALNYTQYVMKKGEKLKLKAAIAPRSAKGRATFQSSNPKAVSVTSNGQVKAKASKGKAVITVTAGGKKAKCKITIGTPVKKVTASDISLTVGASASIKASLSPKKASVKKLIYQSSDPSVASVNGKGVVTAVKAGTASITVTAADRRKVKKAVRVQVGEAPAPSPAPQPTPQPVPDPEPVPEEKPTFSIGFEQSEMQLEMGERQALSVFFDAQSEVENTDVIWSSSDDMVAAIVSAQGEVLGLTPGTTTITATAQQDERVSASMEVTVSEDGVVSQTASSGEALLEALQEAQTDAEHVLLTLESKEEALTIPEGTYDNVTLVVDAPNATIENHARFAHVLIRNIAEDTWCEKSGNHLFLDSAAGHIVVDKDGNPNVYLSDSTQSVTVDNNGNLKELLIASAAKVLVKGDSVASRVNCEYYNGSEGHGQITTYVPLDIYSTTTYQLLVGPGGEQTAVKVSREEDIPVIRGLGTLSVTIDSTGENRYVIAENTGELQDLPKTAVSGRILKDADGSLGTVEGTVYLVRYVANIENDDISVYLDGSSTRQTQTDDAGNYAFSSVALGNYVIVAEVDGYELLTQNIYIDSNYGEDRAFLADDMILTDAAGRDGALSGMLTDASTGQAITKGLKVILRKGMNNITTKEVAVVTSDLTGMYRFLHIAPGQYTIQIRDDSEEPEYVSSYENVSILADASVTRNMTLTRGLDTGEVRFVLTWGNEESGASADLDIHLYGPRPFEDGEYEVSFSNRDNWSQNRSGYRMDGTYVPVFAELDVDDKAYDGPETITVKDMAKGQYKIFVHDYSSGGAGSQLYASAPVVKAYRGNTLMDTFKMPEKEGGVWFVGSYDGETGKVTVADEVYSGRPNTSIRAQIGTALNQLTQFDVIDAEAFAQDQKLVEEVSANYLKDIGEEQLSLYLSGMQALLEKLKNGLTMERIKVEGGVRQTYLSYVQSHNLYNIWGSSEALTDFEVVMKDADAAYRLEKRAEEDLIFTMQYRLILENASLGVSTNYYFNYIKNDLTEYWVTDIMDPDNVGWKREMRSSNTVGYTGGMNAEPGRNLDITLADDVQLVSMEYAADVPEEEWEYDAETDLVLHLQKEGTGETLDYSVHYKPLGAELVKITDATNRIVSQESTTYHTWYQENYVEEYRVFGENPTMGTNWTAEVSEGASYTLSDAREDDFYGRKPEKILTVTHPNGARQVYHIYYYEDTSDAEIVGIYDPDNMYTVYQDTIATSTASGTYYRIELGGMNSELGNGLLVHTRAGASAKVEYTTGSESWDERSSQARITVTAESGKKRIYYVTYRKANLSSGVVCNIRNIRSSANTLKKVYQSGNEIYITGSEPDLGEVEIATDAGYTASCQKNVEGSYYEETITVTETATGSVKELGVTYRQDDSSLRIRDIASAQKLCSVEIASALSTASETGERYYRVDVKGDPAECPKDLTASVPTGATATITYAKEDWPYALEYAAKIEVSNGTHTILYLVSYRQDDSGAAVAGITDTANRYTGVIVPDYPEQLQLIRGEEGVSTYESVYILCVKGGNKTLGDGYRLSLPAGGAITGTIRKGEAGWNYTRESIEKSGYYDGVFVSESYTLMDRVVIKAQNGAERIYVIAYRQDDRETVIKGITDANNRYVNTMSLGPVALRLQAEEGETASAATESVYIYYVKGNNAELGTDYELLLPKGGTIRSMIHRGEAGWKYADAYQDQSYYDAETEKLVSDRYFYTDRVVITGSNGAERIYVIAYAQDQSETVVKGITDTQNVYIKTMLRESPSQLPLQTEGEEAAYESAYMIYVKGDNAELGSSYALDIPEGGSVSSTIRKGEAGWKYSRAFDSQSYYEEASGEWIDDNYYYMARVTVTGSNGAERIYVIAYAQERSGIIVSGIADAGNRYIHTEISEYAYSLRLNGPEGEEGEPEYEAAYVIYVKGENAELGSGYQLSLPEGSRISSTIRKGEAGWNYAEEYQSNSYRDEETGDYISDDYYYMARVTVTASNGAERIYVIAYAKDQSGVVVSGIADAGNRYIYTELSEYPDTLRLNTPAGGEGAAGYEEAYVIYVKGENAELGNSYQLSLSEGSRSSTIRKGEAGWNYAEEYQSVSCYDEETGEWINDKYYYMARVTVTAANGAERIYVIAYAQDWSGIIVSGIADASNRYIHTEISKYASHLRLNTPEGEEGEPEYEEVYVLYVKGENAELGSSYQLTLPEGSRISSTIRKGEAGWNYAEEYDENGYYDEETERSVYDNYYYMARVTVTASNGVERIYVIAYAQDQSGVVVSGIADAGNRYIHEIWENSPSRLRLNTPEEEGEPEYEAAYVIYVKGENAELGSSYQLTLPEGSRISSTIRKGEAGWNYAEEYQSEAYYEEETGKYIQDDYYYMDRVTVTASNGVERIYVIAYAQDQSGVIISGITDVSNRYIHEIWENSPSRLRLNTPEEEGEPEYEAAYVIYVKGENAELGSSYQLTLPEGSRISSTIRKGEAGWNYAEEYQSEAYYEEETGKYIQDDYYYMDRVIVKALNGVERIYVIAYASAQSAATE